MIMKNQKTKDLLQFINSEQLDSFSHGVFDLDQTLYDYETCNQNGIENVINHVNNAFNIDKRQILDTYLESRKKVNQDLKNTSSMHSRFLYLKKMSETLSIEHPIKNTVQFYNIYWDKFFEKMKLFEWVIPTFERLKEKNIHIIIATDFNARLQFLKISELEIDSYIKKVITSQEVGQEKPSKKFAEIILNEINSSSNEVFCVGDNPKKDIFLSHYDVKTFII
jgi:HAD superfamily hydrolase (TIGR01549 family)